MLNFFKLFKKDKAPKAVAPSLVQALRNKYATFQNLLAENNRVLTYMADMEEKLSGEFLFDRQYVNRQVSLISEGVRSLVQSLNAISSNRYPSLHAVYRDITDRIDAALAHRHVIPPGDLTTGLDGLNREMIETAGGKMAHLGEVRNRVNLPVPDGFSITAYAFKRFMEHNGFADRITQFLSGVSIDDMEHLHRASVEIQALVSGADVPPELVGAIQRGYEELCRGTAPGHAVTVSVRSSAIHEDGEFSFAGQYATFLNVPGDQIIQRYKDVVASLFTPRALFYCATQGFVEEDLVMAVGVLRMVDARAGGVLYTRDPNAPALDALLINALHGLGKAVVDGDEHPEVYVVSRRTGEVAERSVPKQGAMAVCAPEGGIRTVTLPAERLTSPCLTDEELRGLHEAALALELHYGRPQDIEWVIDRDGKLFILQSRQLRVAGMPEADPAVPRRVEGHAVLIDRGAVACKGVGAGPAFVLTDEDDLGRVPDAVVLVARHTSTKFVTVMQKVAAIVTDVGGATGHMASLAREYNVPTLLDTDVATTVIRTGDEITVDAVNGNIYAGRVEELLRFASQKRDPLRTTRLFTTLERVLKLIVPLGLVDPDADAFRPDFCRTYHDITRFVHEKAMAEIFKTEKGDTIDTIEDVMSAVAFAESGEAKRLGSQAASLRAGIPVDALLLDIDGGLRAPLKKVTPDDITSVPFRAFLAGLTAMRWPEPRPADIRGFLGMIANTASIPEEQLRQMAQKSFAIISGNYMNFSIRLGYHFSMVEAYAGESVNDNYIKFFFKGGGAATERRLRRVRLIREILKKLGFRVNVTEDVIDAMVTKYRQESIEEKLTVMGKLTVYTKQLDMALYNEAVTDLFVEEFVKDHVAPRQAASS